MTTLEERREAFFPKVVKDLIAALPGVESVEFSVTQKKMLLVLRDHGWFPLRIDFYDWETPLFRVYRVLGMIQRFL